LASRLVRLYKPLQRFRFHRALTSELSGARSKSARRLVQRETPCNPLKPSRQTNGRGKNGKKNMLVASLSQQELFFQFFNVACACHGCWASVHRGVVQFLIRDFSLNSIVNMLNK
jgi:hypothetical protein